MLAFGHRAVNLVFPADRVVDVAVGGRDVVVAHEHQVRVAGELVLDPGVERFEPGHLVDELVAVGRLAVGEVGSDDAHAAKRGMRHRGSDDARLLVGEPRDVAHRVDASLPAQQCHAVVGLLPEPLRLVAGRFDVGLRELVVRELGFLKHQGIDRVGRQPVKQLGQADGQGVDVPGGEFHSASRSRWRARILTRCDESL